MNVKLQLSIYNTTLKYLIKGVPGYYVLKLLFYIDGHGILRLVSRLKDDKFYIQDIIYTHSRHI